MRYDCLIRGAGTLGCGLSPISSTWARYNLIWDGLCYALNSMTGSLGKHHPPGIVESKFMRLGYKQFVR